MVILGFALGGGILARSISIQPMVFLGNVSYAMYIVHVPVGMWIKVIARRLFSTNLSGFAGMVFYVAVVVCLSALVFKIVEEPTNRFVKRKLTFWLDAFRRKNAELDASVRAPQGV